jgi:hypothetical protein
MGMPIGVGAINQVTVQYEFAGQLYQNNITYVVASITGTQDSDTLNSQLAANLTAAGSVIQAIKPLLPASVTIINLFCQWQFPTRLRRFNTPLTVVGTGPSTNTGNVAFTLTRVGPLAKRNNISSFHLPGCSDETISGGGQWTPAFLLAAAPLAVLLAENQVLTAGAAILSPVIWHRKLVPAGQSAQVLQCFGQPTIRVMRRRTIGVGR